MNEYTFNKIAEQAFDAEIQKIAEEGKLKDGRTAAQAARDSRDEGTRVQRADSKMGGEGKLTRNKLVYRKSGSSDITYTRPNETKGTRRFKDSLSPKKWDDIGKRLTGGSYMPVKADSVVHKYDENDNVSSTAYGTGVYGNKVKKAVSEGK